MKSLQARGQHLLLPKPKSCLPSKACKHSCSLSDSTYVACGEAASALYTMVLLQVHQAKALKDLHRGGHDPEVLKVLRKATDLMQQALKVTARSLGNVIFTLVVQEHHLWLCLADLRVAARLSF